MSPSIEGELEERAWIKGTWVEKAGERRGASMPDWVV
jgi:hypothetical protein